MPRKLEPDKNKPQLEEFSTVLPQPIAIAVSRISLARSNRDQIDACLKAGEVTTRYVAILCMASFRARKENSARYNSLFSLKGNLAWGHFLTIVQKVSSLKEEHPLYRHLASFRSKKNDAAGPGDAIGALESLLSLRNELGHNLATLSEAKAKIILEKHEPLPTLIKALTSLKAIMSFPLFLLENQRFEKGQTFATALWLTGNSSEPKPDEISLDSRVNETGVPYVAVDEELLSLSPLVLWDAIPSREIFGLLLLDAIESNNMRFQSMFSDRTETNGDNIASLRSLIDGEIVGSEKARINGGKTFYAQWREERDHRLEAIKRHEGAMNWELFDADTMAWYAQRLTGKSSKESVRAEKIISEKLFEGRVRFLENDRKEALLLFGNSRAIEQSLGRNTIDLRYVSDPGSRWDERKEICANVLVCLREAVDFFAEHVKIPETSMESLDQTKGSPDYLAMREALVNQFIHQDYSDQRASAQVEIRPDDVMFFNPGFSFVSNRDLVEGGKSQARNPLIARALRLIGFAELAGSGLRTLQYAWRDAHRKPPKFESVKDSNSFTVNLDWRLVANLYDEFWKTRLGVTLTPEQAQMMNLCGDPAGITIEQAASGTGLKIEDTMIALNYLERQTLIQNRDDRYFVADHLRDLVK